MKANFLSLGENRVNGFVINIVRFVPSETISSSSRRAAKYFGTITTPSGEVINLGDNGKTATWIKSKIGMKAESQDDTIIADLEAMKAKAEELGLDTSAIEEKISSERERIERERAERDAQIASERKEKIIKRLLKARSILFDFADIVALIDEKLEGLG